MGMDPVTIGLVGSALLGAGTAAYSADKQRSAANQAQDKVNANAQATATAADQANNKANQKSPDASALLTANQLAGKNGPSGTMLTGPSGISPDLLNLGKTSLLGS